MTTTDWAINSWQELAVMAGILAAVSGVIGGMIKSRMDQRSTESAQADRLIRLAEVEAEKRVEIVRTEFELKIAQAELAHRDEMRLLREQLEKEIAQLRGDLTRYKCELAPVCSWRNGKTPPPQNLLAS